MDKEKKEELAEMDSRWNFEKTVKVPHHDYYDPELDWESIRQTFNMVQEDQGDLYMTVSKFDNPSRLERLKLKYYSLTMNSESYSKVTIHHSQIYGWFEKLANHLDVAVGEAVYKVLFERDKLREKLDLGDTVNVEVSSIAAMDTEKTKVDEDELRGMIEDD